MLQANERLPLASPRRIRGRWALERAARSLLIRVHRFGRCRASTRADVLWCARAIDSLDELLRGERPSQFHDGENEE
jgi:hypothetical protein